MLVKGLTDALRASRGLKLLICNVATQRGETEGFSALDHVKVIEKHIGKNIFDLFECNNSFSGKLNAPVEWVKPDDDLREDYRVYEADLIDDIYPWRHDSKKIAKTVINLYEERTGPLNGL